MPCNCRVWSSLVRWLVRSYASEPSATASWSTSSTLRRASGQPQPHLAASRAMKASWPAVSWTRRRGPGMAGRPRAGRRSVMPHLYPSRGWDVNTFFRPTLGPVCNASGAFCNASGHRGGSLQGTGPELQGMGVRRKLFRCRRKGFRRRWKGSGGGRKDSPPPPTRPSPPAGAGCASRSGPRARPPLRRRGGRGAPASSGSGGRCSGTPP